MISQRNHSLPDFFVKRVEESYYFACCGSEVIVEGNDLPLLLRWLEETYQDATDVVVWEAINGELSVVASTCRGWLTINNGLPILPVEKFGISFTQLEMRAFKQLFKEWDLMPWVNKLCSRQNGLGLTRDGFKVFVNKLLSVVRCKSD